VKDVEPFKSFACRSLDKEPNDREGDQTRLPRAQKRPGQFWAPVP